MAWEIDYIRVKGGGLFATHGQQRVMIDENGNAYAEDIPGRQGFNLNLDQYKTVVRRYQVNDLITSYCNNTTHTFYRVYAINERPFVRVEADINQAKCGYEAPLPEPSVPTNPFGTPVYGLYRTFWFCDIEGQVVEVDIEANAYDGPVFPINVGARSPVVLSYPEVDDKFAPIRAVECILSFVVEEDFVLQEFYSSDERKFRVTVKKKGNIQFRGYIIPDSCAEPFDAPPYDVTIRATDALGGLKSVTYPVPVGSTSNVSQSFLDILAYCFAMTNLNLDIVTICNLYESRMPTTLNDDPMLLASVNPLVLSKDNGTTMTVYEVLEKVARGWGAYIVQANGVWNFVRINELSNEVIRRRRYNYTGLFLYADIPSVNRIVGSILKE